MPRRQVDEQEDEQELWGPSFLGDSARPDVWGGLLQGPGALAGHAQRREAKGGSTWWPGSHGPSQTPFFYKDLISPTLEPTHPRHQPTLLLPTTTTTNTHIQYQQQQQLPLAASNTLKLPSPSRSIAVDNIIYNRRRGHSSSTHLQLEEQRHLAPVIIQENPPVYTQRNQRAHTFNTDTMCTTGLFTYVHADGYHETVQEQPVLCPASQYGQPCHNNVVFTHPPQMVHLPPTPQYSSSPSTPSYRSGDDSDRSRGSGSSNKKRSSGIYYNGQKVLPLSRREGNRRERIVVVENPPTPRTPPQTWNAPHTAPSSPNGNAYVIETSPRESSRRHHPVIVDERNRSDRHVQIEIVDSDTKRRRSRSHSRHTSTSSSHSDEDKERRRRHQREKKREEEEIRDQRMRARIAQANAEINSRPAVPMAPAPKRASTYKRGAFEMREPEDILAQKLASLQVEDERREEKARLQEEEAQRQRLKERMTTPNRRASVGPGSRRHRVQYPDGLYRWE